MLLLLSAAFFSILTFSKNFFQEHYQCQFTKIIRRPHNSPLAGKELWADHYRVDKSKNIPHADAACLTASLPIILMICARAVMSSLARKNGYRPLSRDRNITPADQISTAEKEITR